MNPIGNNVYINQNAPVISAVLGNQQNIATMQGVVAMQLSQNKHNLVPKVKKINKSNKTDPDLEHEKETQREVCCSTQEYKEIFMHNNKTTTTKLTSTQITKYSEISEDLPHHIEDIQI